MFELYMAPKISNIVGLMPTDRTIALTESGHPYIQMDDISVSNPVTAVHQKV